MDFHKNLIFHTYNLHKTRTKLITSDPSQLETDPALLIPKSRAALARYGHQLVIGNDIHRRKIEVVFVERLRSSLSKESDDDRRQGVEALSEEFEETWLRLDGLVAATGVREGEVEIEELIVKALRETSKMARRCTVMVAKRN